MWKIDDMPGPTSHAKVLQHAQMTAYDAWCTARNDARMANKETSPEAETARTAYDETVSQLVALLGVEAPCHQVDSELFSEFSDFYKDVVGCRPRFPITRAEVQNWIARHSTDEQALMD